MKSKNSKIQKILMKGIAILATGMMIFSPMLYATTSLDDGYLESSWWEQILYGTIGSTVREIEEYFNSGETTLYITNETQLRSLAEYVNNGNSCEGKEIILLNDIEVDRTNLWTSIGKPEAPFRGIFNGNEYTIFGLKFLIGNSNSGFFGYVDTGKINNLNVSNLTINSTSESVADNTYNIGGLVGYLTNGEIVNCKITDSTIGDSNNNTGNNVGGIVGYAYNSTIKQCTNRAIVLGLDNVGGIVGYGKDSVNIERCTNEGIIEARVQGGGIAGRISYYNISSTEELNPRIINCQNEGIVTGREYIGGIVGGTYEGIINKCYNHGEIIGNTNVGGITGYLYGVMQECKNDGEIKGTESIGRIAGEIAGQALKHSEIKYCINQDSKKSLVGVITDLDPNVEENKPRIIGCITYSGTQDNGNIINLSNETTISETYEITGKIDKTKCSEINISNFDAVYTFNASKGEVVFKNTIGVTIEDDITNNTISTIFSPANVTYTIYKNNQKIENSEYLKAGDVIKVTANFDKYLAKSYGPLVAITEAPNLKINDKIEMTAGKIKASTDNYTTTIDYTYTVEDGVNINITSLNLSKSATIYAISGDDYLTNHPTITTSSVATQVTGMEIDTIKPTINTKVYVENMLEKGRYTAGKEILFEVTTSEHIDGMYELPQIQVSFSESDIGKYNYRKEEGKSGFAKCKSAVINLDGTTTWTFSYIIQERDEGRLEFTFTAGEIRDIAGNTTDIKALYTPSTKNPLEPITGTEWSNDLGVTYEFYKNSVSEANKITSQTYFTDTDDLIVVATYDKVLYVLYANVNKEDKCIPFSSSYVTNLPSLYLNGDSNLKSIATSISSKNEIKESKQTKVTYKFKDIAKNEYLDKLTLLSKVVLKNENNITNIQTGGGTHTLGGQILYSTEYYENYSDENKENLQIVKKDWIKTTDRLDDIIIDSMGVTEKIEDFDITADTAAPTVTITANTKNPTNADEILYTFEFSEEVERFGPEDITVNNGIKVAETVGEGEEVREEVKFKEVIEGLKYTLEVKPTIPVGNEGILQVIVEEGTCKDLVAINNVRQENNITIDKVKPTFTSFDAYGKESEVDVSNIYQVKEVYKVGDKVEFVATFSENISQTAPTLVLKFEDNPEVERVVNSRTFTGNKITYTYTIQDGDNGKLSVKGFDGNVTDIAGNALRVTNKTLNSNTIIADTKAPTLVGITAIAPNFEYDELLQAGETKRYGLESKTRDKNIITIITEYSENIYNLNSKTINKINDTTAPVLKINLGNSQRGAKYEKVEGNKIYYTYEIGANGANDNGELSIASLKGTLSDIAGNTYTIDKLPTLNKYEGTIENVVENIVADASKPVITVSATAVNKDENENEITGNKNGTIGYYRKGSVITIKAETEKYVYKNNNKELTRFAENGSDAPQLNISFSTSGNAKGKIECTNVEYKAENGNNKTIFTYTYTIKEDDNGTLNLNIAAQEEYDIALNENNIKTQSISNIIADTVNPVTNWQSWVSSEGYGIKDNLDGTWEVTFNERLYDYNLETHKVENTLSTSNAPLLLVSKDNIEPLNTNIHNIDTNSEGKTVITYTYSPYSRNIGAYGMKFANVSDKAGNLFNYKDQQAPTLLNSNIEVASPETGEYKAGQEITMVATFSEKLDETSTAPILQLQFSDSGDAKGNVSTGVIDENRITYTYTIKDEDNGVLSIKSFTGTELKDLSGNLWVAPTSVTLTGNKITADTIAPTVTITSDVEKTNKDVVTYTFTWSEKVKEFTVDNIEVTNGSKGKLTQDKNNKNVYSLEVDTTNEGRQIVKVNSGVCEDIAGNENLERVTYNKVVIDYTKPVVRAKVNGGNYVLDNTDPENKKSTLKETIVVDEELLSLQYVWSSSETIPEAGWVSEDISTILVNSDINLTKEVKETGTYYLYIKATDIAGNILSTRTKAFVVKNPQITLTPNITEATNQDVTVTVEYGEGLTENRKAGVSGLTQSADASKVIVAENGTVYAEATDKAGNKVCEIREIENIDKTAPEATINYTTNEDGSVTAKISFNEETIITNNDGKDTYVFTKNGEFTFEFKDLAENTGTAKAVTTSIKDETKPETPPVEEDKTAPTITFSYTTTIATVGTPIGATITTDEDAIISYSWDNKTWNSSEDYVRSQKVVKTPTTAGSYRLYAKAIDKSSNASTVQSLQFTVVRSEEEIKTPEIIFEDLPIIQVNGVRYVKIFEGMTTENLASKMNKQALLGKTPEYIKLTKDNKLRTGSEITINGETKYIVVVKGDINCDGKAGDFIEDIMALNRYRIKGTGLSTEQILAGDINNDRIIDFIDDIMQINRYRIGIISIL